MLRSKLAPFPRTDSHSGQSEARDFAAPPSALSSTEKALHKELIKTARALAKRGVPGVYAHVADVAEQVSAAKAYGANAIPPLARGIDGLKDKQATHTKLRRDDEAIKYLREEDRKEGGNTYYDEIADLIRDLHAHVLVLEAAQPQNDPDEDVENGDEPAQEAAGRYEGR